MQGRLCVLSNHRPISEPHGFSSAPTPARWAISSTSDALPNFRPGPWAPLQRPPRVSARSSRPAIHSSLSLLAMAGNGQNPPKHGRQPPLEGPHRWCSREWHGITASTGEAVLVVRRSSGMHIRPSPLPAATSLTCHPKLVQQPWPRGSRCGERQRDCLWLGVVEHVRLSASDLHWCNCHKCRAPAPLSGLAPLAPSLRMAKSSTCPTR